MRMLPTISLKKEEPLLPQTIETPGLKEPGNPEKVTEKSATKPKVGHSSTKKSQKKKLLKSFLDGATSVLFTLLCLAPGMIVMVLLMEGF